MLGFSVEDGECTCRLTSQLRTRLLVSDCSSTGANLIVKWPWTGAAEPSPPRHASRSDARTHARAGDLLDPANESIVSLGSPIEPSLSSEIITTTEQVSGAVHCRVSFLKLDIYYDPVCCILCVLDSNDHTPDFTRPSPLYIWNYCKSYTRRKTVIELDEPLLLQVITL